MQGVSVVYVCTKFEAASSIPSKVIRGPQNFEIGSGDPGHAHLAVSSIPSKFIKGVPKFGN